MENIPGKSRKIDSFPIPISEIDELASWGLCREGKEFESRDMDGFKMPAPPTRPTKLSAKPSPQGLSSLSSSTGANLSVQTYTKSEVARHNTASDCWVILHDRVYDVTSYLNLHPGGGKLIFRTAGTHTPVCRERYLR